MWKSTAAAGHLGTYISIKNILNVNFYALFIKERKWNEWNMATKVQKKSTYNEIHDMDYISKCCRRQHW